jgi:HD superfamily phosphohydrolase YqeK
MSLFEIIIYLADYIEDGRTFEDCVYLRNFFYEKINLAKSMEEKLEILCQAMVLSFDLTIKNLIDEGKMIDSDTISSRNYFLTNKLELEN